MKIFLTTLILLVAGCTEGPTDKGSSGDIIDPQPSEAVRTLPPGFLDEPPPPPTSNSLVLSGGTLVTQTEIADAIIVVTDGKLVAWGQRGSVDVPNDSIGYDMRAKYIVPGTESDLAADRLPMLKNLKVGAPASFLIIERFGNPDENLLGYLNGSELIVETITD